MSSATSDPTLADAALPTNTEDVDSTLDEPLQSNDTADNTAQNTADACPLYTYTRRQLLFLSKSPLVKPPDDLPSLKDWFGDWNEQVSPNKKEADAPITANGARSNRLRREHEEGDSARPAFRTSLSQQSAMGSFKHQPLHTGKDRDREKDGQEKLRSLSDKYDRDRLGAGANGTSSRNKDRELAPHLPSASASTTRLGDPPSSSSRRGDIRDAPKKKAGDGVQDWRRGGDARGRDDGPDSNRRDREDRERPRSRARNSSRTRRDPSSNRRDRDRDDKDSTRDQDRRRTDRERDRDRDRHRRDKDKDDSRRDRDADKDGDGDPRHWRDDGKRDERIAARRDRERDRERDRDRWDRNGNDEDRTRDREKRGGRDRKGGGGDEGREKEDRKDRDKDKEPAWMADYVPSSPGAGILGGKGADGEMDEIQAWKKALKAKEQPEKEKPVSEQSKVTPREHGTGATAAASPLDEIQQFKQMMKIAQSDAPETTDLSQVGGATSGAARETAAKIAASTVDPKDVGSSAGTAMPSTNPDKHHRGMPAATPADDPQSLLSLLGSSSVSASSSGLTPQAVKTDPVLEAIERTNSRFFPGPSSQNQASVSTFQNEAATPEFIPPTGSRLLAFGARGAQHGTPSALPSQSPVAPGQFDMSPSGPPVVPPPGLRATMSHGSSPPIDQIPRMVPDGRAAIQLDMGIGVEGFDASRRSAYADEIAGVPMNRTNAPSPGMYMTESAGRITPTAIDGTGAGFAAAKGSRFAKFFDNRPREPQASGIAKGSRETSATPPLGISRYEQAQPDSGAMDRILAMLNNPTQGPRAPSANAPVGHMMATGAGVALGGHTGMQPQRTNVISRQDLLSDNRPEDRNFTPDNLVPGLRNVPPPRSRDPNIYPEQFEDSLLNAQRLQYQRLEHQHRLEQQRLEQQRLEHHQRLEQQRLEQMLSGLGQPVAHQAVGGQRHPAGPYQQHFRGGSSPMSAQAMLQGGGQQRFAPGLANLGGRPPHDPSQLSGPGAGLPANGFPSGISPGMNQPQFNNFAGVGPGFGGSHQQQQQQQMRMSPASAQLQSGLGGLGSPNGLDARAVNQAQLLSLGNMSIGPGMRGGAGPNPQAGLNAMSARQAQLQQQLQQQQQQQLQQQQQQQMQQRLGGSLGMGPPLGPQNLGHANPQTQDLMALLMGARRE